MTEVQAATTELKAHYAAQMAEDLERNAKEQERITAELTALQDQLIALQRDQQLLESVQQALGEHDPATGASSDRSTETTPTSVPRQTRTKRSPGPKAKKIAAAPVKKPMKAVKPAGQPTLGELIRNYLADQPEPRSAAEIADGLAQTHPGRNAKATVVRTTVEGLVAKGHVERTKQGKSVFYTALGDNTAPATTTSSEGDAAS